MSAFQDMSIETVITNQQEFDVKLAIREQEVRTSSDGLLVETVVAVVGEHDGVPLHGECPGSAAVLLGERPHGEPPRRHVQSFAAGLCRLPDENRGPAGREIPKLRLMNHLTF